MDKLVVLQKMRFDLPFHLTFTYRINYLFSARIN